MVSQDAASRRAALMPILDILFGTLAAYALYAVVDGTKTLITEIYAGRGPEEVLVTRSVLLTVILVSMACDFLSIRLTPANCTAASVDMFVIELGIALAYAVLQVLAETRSPLIFVFFGVLHFCRMVWLSRLRPHHRLLFRLQGLAEACIACLWIATYTYLPAVGVANVEPGGYRVAREAALIELLAIGNVVCGALGRSGIKEMRERKAALHATASNDAHRGVTKP